MISKPQNLTLPIPLLFKEGLGVVILPLLRGDAQRAEGLLEWLGVPILPFFKGKGVSRGVSSYMVSCSSPLGVGGKGGTHA